MTSLPVLLYHKLHPDLSDSYTVSIDAFRHQLTLLNENGYASISCKQLYDSLMHVDILPHKPVLITFDEGHISCYKHAKSILEEFGFTATFFAFGDWVLVGSFKENEDFQDCMNIEHLRELAKTGFEIGIHGYSAISFKELKLRDIQIEISKSMILFGKLEIPLTNVLAYPFGAMPDGFWKRNKMYRMLKQQKIMLAFNKRNRLNNLPGANRLNINRIEIKGKDSEKNFLTKINLRGWNFFK